MLYLHLTLRRPNRMHARWNSQCSDRERRYTRVAKGTIANWSCDPATSGFSTTSDYILGPGGEQVTEMAMNSGGSALLWQHTNVWAGGKLLATYDKDGLHFYLNDPLGSRRVQTDYAGVVEQTCLSLPFGDGLNCSGTIISPTEHHFTGKERDAESGNDYFGARYFGSSMGRFLSPDAFFHDSHVADPQSWNEYAYARNNPLRYTDPTGQNATVSTSCSTDSNNHTTCNVSISASVAIYAAPGSGLTQDQLKSAASTITSSIDRAWSGSFSQNGVSYNVSTQVSVQVADSASDASKTGAQNVVGLTNGPVSSDASSGTGHNYGLSLGTLFRGQDTGIWNYQNLAGDVPHEFTHLLGVDDHNESGLLSSTYPSDEPSPRHASAQDFRWGVQEATQKVDSTLNRSSPPSSFSNQVNVGVPTFGWWK